MAEDSKRSVQQAEDEEDPVLGLYFDAEHDILAADNQESNNQTTITSTSSSSSSSSSSFKPINNARPTPRNVEPMETTPKPPVTYETKIPSSSTIIALISQRRLDRITPAQARRTDTCLPCGDASSSSSSSNELHRLPCQHTWCRQCLARALLFAKNNNTFDRLRCCDSESDIPLSYFERIAEDRERPSPQWEKQATEDESDGKNATETTALPPALPGLRDWNPIRVVPRVEKDTDVFLTRGDVASYKEALLEFQTLPKDRIYCPRSKSCGSFIPPPASRRGKKTVTCPRCDCTVCLRCRKNPSSHSSANGTKCTAGPARMDVVKNDRKLLVLARRKGWKRCPRCRMFVEKVKGNCSSVVCFCGRYFFYG